MFRGYLNDLNDNDPTEKWSAEMHRSLLFKFFEFLNDLNDNDAIDATVKWLSAEMHKSLSFKSFLPPIH